MRLCQSNLLASLALLLAACSSNTATSDPSGGSRPFSGPGGSSARQTPPPPAPAVSIPAGARFTIVCATYTGPNHMLAAKTMRAQLEALPNLKGMKDWYIVHGENQSTLNYGFYKEADAQARADQDAIQALVDKSSGRRLFPYTPITPLETADAVGPREWDLLNAKGFWTLQIAAFAGVPERKDAAVTAVRELRDQGVEAYYFHGPNVSSVLVGAFPRSAVREQDTDVAASERNDPSRTLVVVQGMRLPSRDIRTPDGERTKVLEQRVEVVDPRLKEAMRKFPLHYVNYQETRRKIKGLDGQVRVIPDPSVLVMIPQKEDVPQPGLPTLADPTVPPDLTNPNTPSGGRLRRLGE